MYRDVMREGLDASKLEHELRCYVIRQRLRQFAIALRLGHGQRE